MNTIRFLHIVKDDKFLHPVMSNFANYENINSQYVYFRDSRKDMRFIRDEDNVEIYSESDAFIRRIQQPGYDVLYLHSLQINFYPFINYIPKDKIVIWWAWGYDIYGQQILGLDSFVNLDFFRKRTQDLHSHATVSTYLKRFYAKLIIKPKLEKGRKQILKRVDYFQPVCDIDYELMKQYAGLTAKKYYCEEWGNFSTGKEIARNLNPNGSVLIGNSAEYVQNHLDVWDAIKQCIPTEREIVVPLSYGNLYYKGKVKEKFAQSNHNINILENFLPRDEYFKIFDRCSYAVYGTIRQHAMGNIYNALLHGMKVFFYKDSYVYKYLTKIGCVVFAIEDIGENTFTKPLGTVKVGYTY